MGQAAGVGVVHAGEKKALGETLWGPSITWLQESW